MLGEAYFTDTSLVYLFKRVLCAISTLFGFAFLPSRCSSLFTVITHSKSFIKRSELFVLGY